MDIDDEANLHGLAEDDHMMIDGTPAVVSMSSQPDDAMQTDDVAVSGPDMDEEMEAGDKEDDGDELMVVTEEDEKLDEEPPLQSARMSPVDEPLLVTQSFTPFPTLESSPLHSPALSQPFRSNLSSTPPAWPPAPTDVPAVPSRLPDALSVVESGIATEHEEEKQMEDGTVASVRAEPAGSMMDGKVMEVMEGGGDEVEGEQQEELVDESRDQLEQLEDLPGVQDTAADIYSQAEDQSHATDELAEQHNHDHLEDQADVEEDIEESMEDVIPPILLIFSDTLSRSLFFPLPSDVDPPSSLIGDVVLEQKAEEIAHAPLEEFFMELRLALGEEWDETKGVDMVLEQRDVQLTIKENDKQTLQLSLMDIIALHMRLGCPQPLVFHVSTTPENFYRRYKTILGMLDAREASEHGDEEVVDDGEEVGEEGVVKMGEKEVNETTVELKEIEEEEPVVAGSDEQPEAAVAESERAHIENAEESTDVNEVPAAHADQTPSQTDTAIEAGPSSAPATEQQPDAEISNDVSEQNTERQDEQEEFIEGDEEQYEIYDEGEEEHEEQHGDQAADHEQGAEEEAYGHATDAHEDYLENEQVAEDDENGQRVEDDEDGFEHGEEYEEYEEHGDEYGVNGAIAAAETLIDEDSQREEIPVHAEQFAVDGEANQADVVATNGHDDDAEVNGNGASPKKRSLEEAEEDDGSRNVKQKLEEAEGVQE